MGNGLASAIVLLLIVLIVLVGGLAVLQLRRPQESGPLLSSIRHRAVEQASRRLDVPTSASPVFEVSLERRLEVGDLLAVANPFDEGQVMIFGDAERAATYGQVVGPIPGQLAAVAVGANAMVQAGIAMGEQAGMLVRLTGESTRMFKELDKIVDGGGAFMGVLRDTSGQFKHIIRFKPALGLQALSGVTGALSAIAMQAQLASIERAIAMLTEDVHRVQVTLDIQASSRLAGVREVLEDIYRSVQSTGVFTQTAWDQVAPLAGPVFTNRDYAARHLKGILAEIASKRSTGDRRTWFKKNQNRLLEALAELEEAEQSIIQFAGLRLWWLCKTADPTLKHYVGDLQTLLAKRESRRSATARVVHGVLGQAGRTNWFDWTHSPFDTKAVESTVDRLITSLQERGLLTLREIRALTDEELRPEAIEAHLHTIERC